ncbi:MAG: hypothetical protein ACRENG_20900 [bacterium]
MKGKSARQSVVEKELVQGGSVIATGPGTPFPDFKEVDDEPWRPVRREARHLPPQTRVGDYAIFLRKAAVELKFVGKNYPSCPRRPFSCWCGRRMMKLMRRWILMSGE